MIKENNPREVAGVTDRETRLRGYCYSYDALGRLTEALYGENTDLSSNPNRYTERVLEYTANGNVRRFQRHGLKDDGKYGKVDNLHLTYDGNQLVRVLDDAADVTRFASADFPDLSDSSKEYTYDECGALTSDLNHGISSISYDDLGNPRQTRFNSGATTLYVYTPDGRKVREIHNRIEPIDRPSLGAVLGKTVSDTTDYIGPVIYEGRRASTVRFEGGYASFSALAIAGSKPAPTFHYYIPDYLGNNRAVVNVSTGVMEQITHYYPWGGVYADLGTGASVQPFKYGDKELDLSNGIARYDYTARAYVPVTLRFDRPDLYASSYPHISPYAFCANNPVNITDPTGNILQFDNATEEDMKWIAAMLNKLSHGHTTYGYAEAQDTEGQFEMNILSKSDEEIKDSKINLTNGLITKIISEEAITKITINNNSQVIIGDVESATIDIADMEAAGTYGLFGPEQYLFHEIVEQHGIQVKDMDADKAHCSAVQMENNYCGYKMRPKRPIDGQTLLIPYSHPGSNGIIIHTLLLDKNNNIIPQIINKSKQ